MKLRSKKEYESEERVEKIIKSNSKKVKLSSVKQHQAKIRQINHNARACTNEINKFALKLKNVHVRLSRIVFNAEQQKAENNSNFIQAYKVAKERRMNDFLRPVDPLSLEGNVSENWRIFKRNYDIWMVAKGIDEKADVVKIATFLNAIGKDAVEVYDTFNLTQIERTTYTRVIKSFEDFCKPRKNIVYERYRFGSRNQKEGEPFDVFLMDIKKLARHCTYNDEEDMIRDRIVLGVTDSKLRTRLLEEKELTMDKAIEKSRASEASKKQTESMSKTAVVHEISGGTHKHTNQATTFTPRAHGKQSTNNNKQSAQTQHNPKNQQQQRQRYTHNGSGSNSNNKSNKNENRQVDRKNINNCSLCGYTHKVRECPAFGKQCRSCNKQNHFSSMCKQRQITTIDTHTDSDSSEYYIDTINNTNETSKDTSDSKAFPWIEQIKMNGKNVPSKIDTGAETDVLPLNLLKKIGPIELRTTTVTLRAFGGQKIKPTGMCTLLLSCDGISFGKNFAVVDLDFVPIIGLKTSVRLGIVQQSRVFTNKKFKKSQL